MTPQRLKALRNMRGWSQTDLAKHMRLGDNGKRTVARWEAGSTVPGPASVALEALEAGWSPGDGDWRTLQEEYSRCLEHIKECVASAVTQYNRNRRDEG